MKQTFALERQYESETRDITDAPVQIFRSQRVRLIVGSDGVRIDGADARRVLSFKTISRVEVSDESLLTIEHRHGFEFFRCFEAKGKSTAHLVRQVIASRLERFRAASIERPTSSALVTSGTAKARITQLRALSTSHVATYRHTPISHDELWRVVENPISSISERVAAVIVLRARMLEDLVARIEAIAEEIVDDLVARSLRIAAHGNDGELEALFDEHETIDTAPLSLPERLRRRKAL
jgi:hypothetical protein